MTMEHTSSCALCQRAAGRGGPWLDLGWVCADCQGASLDAVLARHGLALADEAVPRQRWLWQIRVRHPTPLAASARLSLERLGHKARKLLGARDPEVGDERFDNLAWVEADDDALPLLEQPAVRAAAVALLQVPMVSFVELAGELVTVHLKAREELADGLIDSALATPRERARPLAVALAVQVERFARAPG